MPEPIADNQRYSDFILAQAKALRANDDAPASRPEWQRRRAAVRDGLLAAIGPMPETPVDLDAKTLGTLDRQGYTIEKVVFRSRPDVWVTANVYVPKPAGRFPAVLCVHGHWAGARRDPVVQARCLGLVKLGFLVLVVDAFGSGERYTAPATGTYHGALYGGTLWPTGYTLLGMQVYDNRRAVDYLVSRPDVLRDKIGITGASGGGNQTMYAGALDERLSAVVPVCSVGTYQAYLKAACCVCEVVPGALRFTEEGDVLGLIAPRPLLVISASKDAFQFSPGEAAKSVERASAIYRLNAAADRVKHTIFESGHDYSRPMREAMYGWMTRWLKGVGTGGPVDEPAHTVEKPEDLACYPNPDDRPAGFLTPPLFAAQQAKALVARANQLQPTHPEAWESSTAQMRSDLTRLLGGIPKVPRVVAKVGTPQVANGIETAGVRLTGELEVPLPLFTVTKAGPTDRQPTCVLLHLGGKAEAAKHPLAAALARRGWLVACPDLRAVGDTAPPGGKVGAAPDHNSAEHAVWIGRPLLGQWALDALTVVDWLATQPSRDPKRMALVGLGPAGLVALTAAALSPERVTTIATVGNLTTLVTARAYPDDTRLGLLVPGLLKAGDVPHLAAMAAPRRLVIADGVQPDGNRPNESGLRAAHAFTQAVYRAYRAADALAILTDARPDDLARRL